MNSVTLMGDGLHWDKLALLDNNSPIDCQTMDARRVFVELVTNGVGIDDDGGNLEAWFDEVAYDDVTESGEPIDITNDGIWLDPRVAAPFDAPVLRKTLLPGTFELVSTKGGVEHTLKVVLLDPEFNFMSTQVFFDGMDITDDVTHLKICIDAYENVMEAWVKYEVSELLGISEQECFMLF